MHDTSEDDMSPEVSSEYQSAIEEAANAFMKVMALRGFSVRDYPQNFVAQMAKVTRFDFEASRGGAHANADAMVCDVLSVAPFAPVLQPSAAQRAQPRRAFSALRGRLA
jgi:hypothetical protein